MIQFDSIYESTYVTQCMDIWVCVDTNTKTKTYSTYIRRARPKVSTREKGEASVRNQIPLISFLSLESREVIMTTGTPYV